MSQSGHERPVDANPNPLGTCFCGVLREDCPGGPGFVSPNEIEGVPGNYANFISLECVQRLAGDSREAQHASQEPQGVQAVTPLVTREPTVIEPHVNPVGESFEEVERQLDAQVDEPVI